MAKISIHFEEGTEYGKEIADAFKTMVEEMSARLYPKGGTDSWVISGTKNGEWFIRSEGVFIRRKIYADHKMLENAFFELKKDFQNKKLSDIAMKASLQISDLLKLERIAVSANIDVGGYAWLRKGAWPIAGKTEILDIVNDYSRTRDGRDLAYKLLDIIEDMSDKELKKYVLSPDFRQFSKIFLNSHWGGSFNPNDPIVRTAMTQGADAAYQQTLRTVAAPKVLPLTINEQIMNEYVKFQIRSIKFSTTLAKQAQGFLNETEDAVNTILLKYGQKFEEISRYNTLEAQKLFDKLKSELLAARELGWVKVNNLVADQLEQYAVQQAKVAAAIVEGPVPVALGLTLPSARTLYSIVTSQPFEGRVLSDWLARTANLDHERITKMAVQGIVDGLTPTDVARLVLGTKAMNGADGYCRKAFKDLESVLLTTTSGIQNQARQALYEENADVFDQEYFVATLDIRTTYECAGHDGEMHKRGQGPMPPLHFRCRSLRVPYISEDIFRKRGYSSAYEKQLLKDFAESKGLVGNYKTREDLPKGLKTAYDTYARKATRDLVGQVPAQTTFNEWLKKQTADFQDEYLGKARAIEFRKGKFSVKDFTSASGKDYTLADLGIG